MKKSRINDDYYKVGSMKERAQVGLFAFAITASGLALASCPGSMPEQLWAMLT